MHEQHKVKLFTWEGILQVEEEIVENFDAALRILAHKVFHSFKIFDCEDNLVHQGGNTDGMYA